MRWRKKTTKPSYHYEIWVKDKKRMYEDSLVKGEFTRVALATSYQVAMLLIETLLDEQGYLWYYNARLDRYFTIKGETYVGYITKQIGTVC